MNQKSSLKSPPGFIQRSLASDTYLLRPNTAAMLRLAFGSATAISTLMCIPDGVGIIPIVPDAQTWVIRMIGNWLAAFIMWFIGCLGMLSIARIAGGGIFMNDGGIKFWRFGKTVLWSNIKAITVESEPAFSFAFCLPGIARRLLLYEEKPKDNMDRVKALFTFKSNENDEDYKLAPHPVPSFQFSDLEFESLFVHICEKSSNFVPNDIDTYIFNSDHARCLKITNERAALLRQILAVIIAISVTMFLGRKASLNYFSNLGNISLTQGIYQNAKDNFLITTKIDPTFAIGWDQLARAEYRSGDVESAEKHWHRALFMKPDLIDAKVGISSLLISRSEYSQAKKLLEQCVRLFPHNCNVYLNLAETCNKLGKQDEARKLLTVIQREGSENVDVLSRASIIYLELNDKREAASLAKRVLVSEPQNVNALYVISFLEKTK
jgi:tetratricopeptide (TPR) repeat protein